MNLNVRIGVRIFACLASLGASGCATSELSHDAMSVAIASNEDMYHNVLINIAYIHRFPKLDKTGQIIKDKAGHVDYSNIVPIDSRISAGQDVINNTAGITTGLTAGGAHGIVVPTVMLPYTHSVQEQANSTPSSDGKLLKALMLLYHSHANDTIFNFTPTPAGIPEELTVNYFGVNIWVDPSNVESLTNIAMDVLGGGGPASNETATDKIYILRQNQSKNQSKSLEDANATSIRTL